MKRVPGRGLWVLSVLLLLLPLLALAQDVSLNQPVDAVTVDGTFSALAPEDWYIAVSDDPEDINAMPLFATSETAADALLSGNDVVFPPDTIVVQVALPGALHVHALH